VCARLAARGERVAAYKPAVTGLEDSPNGWPHDHELLAAAASAGQMPEEVSPWRFGPSLSPHLAAELAGAPIEPAGLLERARRAAANADALVCEGVGGLLVPLTPGWLVRDFAAELGLPVLVAARPGLGTINHSLLTVGAARSAGLAVAGIVMTPWPDSPGPVERSNRATVERLAGVPVSVLPRTEPSALAGAAAELPLDDWL
jgi:dethiobiotin synthetase